MSDDASSSREFARTVGADGRHDDAWESLAGESFGSARPERTRETSTEKASTTQQHDVDDHLTREEYYKPVYAPDHLALLKERSEIHARCIQSKAQGVAGHGFDLVPREETETEGAEPPGRDRVEAFWFGDESQFLLGPDRIRATPAEVQESAWDDYETIGWLALEVLINDNTGDPTGLAHIPAHTIRKRKDAPGYVQVDPDNGTVEAYFGEAGDRYGDDQTFVDADEGAVADSIRGIDTPANELLVIRNYSALAPHYGIPDVIPALETIQGDVAARAYNRRFFENDGVPRFAVIVEGGELTDGAWRELEEKFKELKNPEDAHRGVILEAVSGIQSSFEDAHDVSLRIEPLTVGIEEDASFIEYRKENEHSIMSAHGVPPVVVNRTEKINYANSQAQRRHFAREIIRPKQEKLAARLHRVIHQTMLDVPEWTVEFNLVGGEDEERQAQIDKLRIEGTAGVLTVDEARSEMGLDPLEGPEGNMLIADLSGSGPAGGPGGTSSGGGEAGDVGSGDADATQEESIRRDQRAADLGYDLVSRVDPDD